MTLQNKGKSPQSHHAKKAFNKIQQLLPIKIKTQMDIYIINMVNYFYQNLTRIFIAQTLKHFSLNH